MNNNLQNHNTNFQVTEEERDSDRPESNIIPRNEADFGHTNLGVENGDALNAFMLDSTVFSFSGTNENQNHSQILSGKRDYKIVSLETRRLIYSNADTKSVHDLSRLYGVKETTVRSIIKNADSRGFVENLAKGGDYRSKLTLDQKEQIKRWVDADAAISSRSYVSV